LGMPPFIESSIDIKCSYQPTWQNRIAPSCAEGLPLHCPALASWQEKAKAWERLGRWSKEMSRKWNLYTYNIYIYIYIILCMYIYISVCVLKYYCVDICMYIYIYPPGNSGANIESPLIGGICL
jgi:hypothetical protein